MLYAYIFRITGLLVTQNVRRSIYSIIIVVIMDSNNDSSDTLDCEEIVEETLIHVVMDNADEMSILNPNSNVRVLAVDSDSPVLQIENKVFT